MSVMVNTNKSSLVGLDRLNRVHSKVTTSQSRLSSGLRINSAKDDASGLQIADRLTTQINGLNQGNRNASDAVALAQTIEAGIDEIGNILQRVRTLAVQAANGTNTDSDRAALSKDAAGLTSEITRIAQQTTFGGKSILAGASHSDQKFNVGNDSIFSNTDDDAANLENVAAGEITFLVGANSGESINLKVESFTFDSLIDKSNAFTANTTTGASGEVSAGTGYVDATGTGLIGANGVAGSDLNATHFALSTQTGAQHAIKAIDALIAQVDKQRGELGSVQLRLETSIRNQAIGAANQSDSRSRIRDADFAEESANLTQQSIVQQSASTMLMQANARPQFALSLLG